MVNSVSALSRSLASLRATLARTGQAAPRARMGTAARGSSPREASAGEGAPTELALLPQRLAALSGDTHSLERQALRLFIRAVLVDEFGGGAAPAPVFDELVERAANHLEGDEEFAALTREAMAELRP